MIAPELEMLFEVWSNDYHFEIGADRDGLGCFEIRYYESEEKSIARILFSADEAKLIHEALGKLIEWRESKNREESPR